MNRVKYLLSIICILLVQLSFACECETKSEIDIIDINDSDIILTAILSKFENTDTEINLTFSISKTHKGEIKTKSVFFSIEKNKAHDGQFHYNDTVFIGQKWIIFSSSFKINDELVYKLKKSNDSTFCMLSRPIIDNDQYLAYINKIFQNHNILNTTYYKNKTVFAKGSIRDKSPIGVWTYYTRNDLDHYWEGVYVNGKRKGLWVEKAINYKNERVIINKEIYQNGVLKERIMYNYIREKKMHETFDEKSKKKVIYFKNTISSILVYDKISNTTTIEYFKNGKSNNIVVKNRQVF